MNSKIFHFSPKCKPLSVIDPFIGTSYEKELLRDIVVEWNAHTSISGMCRSSKKKRPTNSSHNLLFLVYNVERLNKAIFN